jgi:hypothetical protein
MSLHPFQTKSKFAMLTVNNVYNHQMMISRNAY